MDENQTHEAIRAAWQRALRASDGETSAVVKAGIFDSLMRRLELAFHGIDWREQEGQ